MCYASSGSSCVAGILHRLGIHMGKHLKAAQQLNPGGFYEDEDFFAVSGKIWVTYHLRSENRYEWDIERLQRIGEKYKPDFARLILHRQARGVHWGVKDPRLSLLVPVFQPFLHNPFFIVAGRNIDGHVRSRYNKVNRRLSRQRFASLLYYGKKGHFSTLLSHALNNIKSIGLTENDLHHLVTSFYMHIDSMVADQPHIYINFDNLLKEPEETIQKIIAFLSLQPTPHQVASALSFISPTLRNYK